MIGIVTNPETGDIALENNTAAIVRNEENIIESVLLASQGDFKESPLLGAGIRQHLGGCRDKFWPMETKKMIRSAGVEVNSVTVDDDDVVTIK